MRVSPDQFSGAETRVAELVASWDGWVVQRWGQDTILASIREILQRTENSLRHLGDLLVARDSINRCFGCGQVHGCLVAHLDVKSTTRSYDRTTGWLTLEVMAWQSLRHEPIPALITFEPYRDCPLQDLLWIPANRLEPGEMRIGPRTANGSGDAYWLLPQALARPIGSLQCWDGWS